MVCRLIMEGSVIKYAPSRQGLTPQAPLLLAFFSIVESILPSPDFAISLVFSLADILSAYYLTYLSDNSNPLKWRDGSIAAKYPASERLDWLRFLFNPLTLATCLGRSSSSFSNLAVLASIAHAQQGMQLLGSSWCRSRRTCDGRVGNGQLFEFVSYVVTPAVAPAMSTTSTRCIIVPKLANVDIIPQTLNYICYCRINTTPPKLPARRIMGLSRIHLWSNVPPLPNSFWHSLLLPDLTPNVGLWWYFFIEMFDSFRSFFLVVFQLHLLIYVIPLTIRLYTNPLAIITTLMGIISIFKSYPSVSDLSVYLGLLSLHTNIFSRIPPPPPNIYSHQN